MSSDAADRLAVRKYLSNGEQPKNGLVLSTRIYGTSSTCKYVIAQESGASILWAFRVTEAGRLLRAHEGLVIVLENEEYKAKASAKGSGEQK
jgi:hypothetical protein